MRILDLAQGRQSPEEAFIDAVLFGQKHKRESLPKILSFYPAAYNNPFQQILYSEAEHNGFVPLSFSNFEELGRINWGNHSYLHIHWLKKILEGAGSKAEAERKIDEFERKLFFLKEHKHKVIWTIHNVLPHNSVFEKSEIRLRDIMCQYSDRVHALATKTKEICEPYFSVPSEKLFFTNHPLYQGYYLRNLTKEKAKFELGTDTSLSLLCFGALDSYKKIDFLIKALSFLPDRDRQDFTLLIAGKPGSKDYLKKLKKIISESVVKIRLYPKQIKEERVQYYFGSVDAVVIPYGDTLNSGVVSLSRSFNKLIISERTSSAEDVYGKSYPLYYEKNSAKSLVEKILLLKTVSSDILLKTKISSDHDSNLSHTFFKVIREICDD